MSKIFISYRRQDSRPVATLIYEPLAKHFEPKYGAGAVFMDVQGIPVGVDFRTYLNEQVDKAELLLALIADRWLISADEQGKRRIDNPDDFVRIEIEAALRRRIPVVPVYIDDAPPLREADLPGGVKPLARMSGYHLRTDSPFIGTDIAQLITRLEPHFTGDIRPPRPAAGQKDNIKDYANVRYEIAMQDEILRRVAGILGVKYTELKFDKGTTVLVMLQTLSHKLTGFQRTPGEKISAAKEISKIAASEKQRADDVSRQLHEAQQRLLDKETEIKTLKADLKKILERVS